MNTYAPIIRIAIRYVTGVFFGVAGADVLRTEPDLENVLVMLACGLISAATEWAYKKAKRKGWAT
jgi:hypothetical protein